jgi:hypothetical protein
MRAEDKLSRFGLQRLDAVDVQQRNVNDAIGFWIANKQASFQYDDNLKMLDLERLPFGKRNQKWFKRAAFKPFPNSFSAHVFISFAKFDSTPGGGL